MAVTATVSWRTAGLSGTGWGFIIGVEFTARLAIWFMVVVTLLLAVDYFIACGIGWTARLKGALAPVPRNRSGQPVDFRRMITSVAPN